MTSSHTNAKSTDTRRSWTAPGGVCVTAIRVLGRWRIEQGPEHLMGREYRNIKQARDAVQQSPDRSVTLDTAYIARRLGVTTQRVRAIARARGIKPARVVGRAFLWNASDLPRFAPGKPGRPPAS
jgi:hypothetical protein